MKKTKKMNIMINKIKYYLTVNNGKRKCTICIAFKAAGLVLKNWHHVPVISIVVIK